MLGTRSSSDRQRDKQEKSRRSHKDSASGNVGKHSTKGRLKSSTSNSKRSSSSIPRDAVSSVVRRRHRRSLSREDDTGSTSSDNDDKPLEHHDSMLVASRNSLTSPSLISTLTSLTTATNTSGGSSGSNSTVTQASVSRQLQSTKIEQSKADKVVCPAAPDPPDVFSFLEQDSPEGYGEVDEMPEAHWPLENRDADYNLKSIQQERRESTNETMSSSTSSSLHSDDAASEPLAGNETDRSSSPERSVKGEEQYKNETGAPMGPTASKVSAQMEAAKQRQNETPRDHHHAYPKFPPRAKTLPSTGYEALAHKLSGSSPSIDPIYRRFDWLNHRLLLCLQDELVELEEQLRRLDGVDTQGRFEAGPKGLIRVAPASRRAGVLEGGKLEWHKMNLLTQIASKLSQYNQTLTSFSELSRNLQPAKKDSVDYYRSYLEKETPVVERETRFLDASDDLFTVAKTDASAGPSTWASAGPIPLPELAQLPNLAIAVAAVLLIPILTFVVIQDFLGRMTVVLLVALGIVGALIQSGLAARDLLRKEFFACALVYTLAMATIAGVSA
ncbi:MAG: hypothetical protein M1818_003055 [Claussenomyces sp. TS43310]|nr:MAG: hypothetical protein M1818_003055 [Claussenomyces sp. TS43310]